MSYDADFNGVSSQGGGNFASPSQGTMNQYGAAAGGSGSGAKKQRDQATVTPMTVKQCLEVTEFNGKFIYINPNSPLQQVKIVANILSVQHKETNIELNTEDGTGSITVRLYPDNADAEQYQSIRDSEYRCIVGTVKRINQSLCIVAYSIAPINDHNQLTAHYLESMLTHQRATLGPVKDRPAVGAAAAASAAAAGGFKNDNGMQIDYQGGAPQQRMGGGGNAMSIRDQVLYQFQTAVGSDTDQGCSISKVAANLKDLSFQQVQDAVTDLSNAGHLYSTIDEEHFKSTAAN